MLRDQSGYVGDRASGRAFASILQGWRERMRDAGEDPLGDDRKVSRQALDAILTRGEPPAAGLVMTAVEEFAQELVLVCRRLLRLETWRNTERIAIGGGFRASRIGELAIGRAGILLKTDECQVNLQPIRHDPDKAGLIGALHLAPPGMFGRDAALAADIGGTNIRVGLISAVEPMSQTSDARVLHTAQWRHADDKPDRETAVRRLAGMVRTMIDWAAAHDQRLVPFVGIGCPGVMRPDGSIERGGQNLPGNWEEGGFNLPSALGALLPEIEGQRPMIMMHNDAVLQGLSELPWMQDVTRWGILTIGTGLGNARFTNQSAS